MFICLFTLILLVFSVVSVSAAPSLNDYPDIFKQGNDVEVNIIAPDNADYLDMGAAYSLRNTIKAQNNCSDVNVDCEVRVYGADHADIPLGNAIWLGNDCNNHFITAFIPGACPNGQSVLEQMPESMVLLDNVGGQQVLLILGATQYDYLLGEQLIEKYQNFSSYLTDDAFILSDMFLDTLKIYPSDNASAQELTLEKAHSLSVSTNFKVLNNNTLNVGDFSVELTNLTMGNEVIDASTQATFNTNKFSLNGLEEKEISLTLIVPDLQKAGDYTGDILFKHKENIYVNLPVTLTVTSTPDVAVSYVTPDNFLQGSTQEMQLSIANIGNDDIIGTYEMTDFMKGNDQLLFYPQNGAFPIFIDYLNQTDNKNVTLDLTFVAANDQPVGTYSSVMTLNYELNKTKTANVYVTIQEVNDAITITQEPNTVSVSQGDQTTFNVTLQNLGNIDVSGTYSMNDKFKSGANEISFSGMSTSGSFDLNYINNTDKGDKTYSVDVIVPTDAPAGLYTANLNVTAADNNYTKQLKFTVLESTPSVLLNVGSSPSTPPGQTVQLNVSITNDGNTDVSGTYVLPEFLTSANGDNLSYTVTNGAKTGSFSLQYDSTTQAQKVFALEFSVPESQAQTTYTGDFNVSYENAIFAKSGNETAQLSVVVEPILTSMSTLSTTSGKVVLDRTVPQVITDSGNNAGFVVKNNGNWPLTITVQKNDLTLNANNVISKDNLVVDVTSFTIGVGEEKNLTISTTLSAQNWKLLTSGTYTGNLVLAHSAENYTVPVSYVLENAVSAVTMGNVNYPESDDDDLVNGSVTVTNTGAVTLSNLVFETTAAATTITNLAQLPSTLAPAESFSVNLETQLSSNFTGGKDVKIGDLKLTSNKINKTSGIYTNIQGKLEITKVKFGGSSVDSDGDTFSKEFEPGDTFEVIVYLENLFTDDEDINIEDIEIDVVVKGVGEDEDDVSGDAEISKLKADEKDSDTITWDEDNEIDFDSESGKHEVTVKVSGEDENGITHEDEWTLEIDVERDSGLAFEFTDIELSKETVTCGSSFTVYVDGRSVGENDKDNVYLLIQNSDLEISDKNTFDIGDYQSDDCDAIEEDDEGCSEFTYSKTFTVASNTKAGTYPITVKWWPELQETLNLKVVCGDDDSSSSSQSSSSSNGNSDNSNANTPTSNGVSTGSTQSGLSLNYAGGESQIPSPASSAFATKVTDTTSKQVQGLSDGVYTALLVLLNILIIGGIIVALAVYLKK